MAANCEIRILIVSPIQAVRAGLRVMLSGWRPGPALSEQPCTFELREAASLAGAVDAAAAVDVLVIDAGQWLGQELETWSGIFQFTTSNPGKLAVLFLVDDISASRRLLEQPWRAWGVLPLEASQDELAAAVWALHQGLWAGAPALLSSLLVRPAMVGRNPLVVTPDLEPLVEPLTTRELEVLQYMAQGLANKQIAARLDISEHTVKYHVSSIYARLGVGSRTEAVRAGFQRGLISL